uniref:Uncharacterized protein n=1 Tax=Rangifer tarandus platyrhynchus TaxID=3082113 RepID=A0ACB0F0Y5_RANTA|nr:unnamed protein product [Rangifer tarandus platyrhynchus]
MAAVGCVQSVCTWRYHLRHLRQARENSALRGDPIKQPRPPPVRSTCALELKLPGLCSLIKGAERWRKGMHLWSLVLGELSMQVLGTVGAMCCRSRRLEKLLMLPEPGTSVCMLSQPT